MTIDRIPLLATWPRGDNPVVELTFTDTDGTALDITNGVVRATLRSGWTSEANLITGASYPSGQIVKSTPLGGIALWTPLIEETDVFTVIDAVIDGEATVRGALVGTGTVTLTNGSANVAIASGLSLATVKKGDLLHLTSGNAANNGPFLVDTKTDTHITIAGYSAWVDETVTASLYRGRRGTPIRYSVPLRADASR